MGTWQGRLPQELRIHGIRSMASADEFLRETYLQEFNQRFAVAAAQPGHAFLPVRGKNLDLIFSLQHERTVNQDNTVHIGPCVCKSRSPVGEPRWPGVGSRRNIKGRPFWSRVWVFASIPTERNALNG